MCKGSCYCGADKKSDCTALEPYQCAFVPEKEEKLYTKGEIKEIVLEWYKEYYKSNHIDFDNWIKENIK